MKIRFATRICSFLLLGNIGCNNGFKTFKEGTHNDIEYELQSRSRSGMFAATNTVDWRIKLGNFPPVPVNAVVTDWGPPYSTDIYGKDPYQFITTGEISYSNDPFTPGSIGVHHTMLYVSPQTLSKTQFETFSHFVMDEWPRITDSVTGNESRSFPHIIGLVYGDQSTYKQEFHGAHDGQAMILRIEPDGRVRLITNDAFANDVFGQISEKVQMPGKRILLHSTAGASGLTMDELRHFKDKDSVAVTERFSIQ